MSWLNNSPTVPDVSPFVSEISRLQKELDLANQSIDDKLDKLEDVGFDVVGLTKKLEDARSRITSLEDEIARLLRREERRDHRLERLRCKKCLLKVNFETIQAADESRYAHLRIYRCDLTYVLVVTWKNHILVYPVNPQRLPRRRQKPYERNSNPSMIILRACINTGRKRNRNYWVKRPCFKILPIVSISSFKRLKRRRRGYRSLAKSMTGFRPIFNRYGYVTARVELIT